MANRVVGVTQEGAVTWVLHPLSYFGWYPFSYPAGEIMVISALDQIMDLEIQPLVYFFSIYVGILGMFTVFLFARTFGFDFKSAFLVVVLFSTLEWVIYISYNNISSRGLFVVMYPVLVFFIFKAYRSGISRYKYIALFFLSSVAILSIHRIAGYFITLIMVPLFVTIIATYVRKKLIEKRYTSMKPNKYHSLAILGIFTIIFVAQIFDITIRDDLDEIDKRAIDKGYVPESTPFFRLFALLFFYFTRYNISIVLIPLAVLWLSTKFFRTFEENFLLMICFFSLFFILDVGYFLYFFAPIAALLMGFGLSVYEALDNKKESPVILFTTWLVVLSSIFYILWYINEGYTILVLTTILGVVFLCKNLLLARTSVRPKLFGSFVIGLLLIQTSYALSTSVYRSHVLLNEADNGTGPIFKEIHIVNDASWISQYLQENWLTSDPNVRNKISTLSALPSPATYNNVATKGVVPGMIDPDFNFTILWDKQKVAFEYDLESRYDPKKIEYNIFIRNQADLITLYGIEWLILSHYVDNVEALNVYTEHNRYDIYNSNVIVIYYYQN